MGSQVRPPRMYLVYSWIVEQIWLAAKGQMSDGCFLVGEGGGGGVIGWLVPAFYEGTMDSSNGNEAPAYLARKMKKVIHDSCERLKNGGIR